MTYAFVLGRAGARRELIDILFSMVPDPSPPAGDYAKEVSVLSHRIALRYFAWPSSPNTVSSLTSCRTAERASPLRVTM